jgi:hypothetical protein
VNVSTIYESIIKIVWCQKDVDILCIPIMNTHRHVYGRGLHANKFLRGVIYNHVGEVDFKIVEKLWFL